MDLDTLRSLSPVLVLLAFTGVCWWAFSPQRRKRFDEAARLPFAEDSGVDTSGVDTSGVATPGVATPGVATPGVATPEAQEPAQPTTPAKQKQDSL